MSCGADYPIEICQGSTFRTVATLYADEEQTTPVDLTGLTPRGMVRVSFADDEGGGAPLATFTTYIPAPPTAGIIVFELTPAQTEAITIVQGVYDIEAESDGSQSQFPAGDVVRLFASTWSLNKEVTR